MLFTTDGSLRLCAFRLAWLAPIGCFSDNLARSGSVLFRTDGSFAGLADLLVWLALIRCFSDHVARSQTLLFY